MNSSCISLCPTHCAVIRSGPTHVFNARSPCVQAFFYSLLGARIPKAVSFGQQLESEGISHICMYSDGFVVVGASSSQFWAVIGLQEPRATRLPQIPGLGSGDAGSLGSSSVSCLAVLEPRFTLSSGLEVRWVTGSMRHQGSFGLYERM